MGRLRDHVASLAAITPRGEPARFKKGDGEFDSILDGTFGGAIKAITFSAVTGKAVEMMRTRFVFAQADFEAAIGLLGHPGIAPGMDLSVHAYHDKLGVIVVSVSIAGKPADHDRMVQVLEQLESYREGPAGGGEARLKRVQASSPAEIVAMTVDGGPSGSHYVDRSLVARHYEKSVARESFELFRTPFLRHMATALAQASGGKAPRVVGSLRLSLDDRRNIVVSADAFLPRRPRDEEIRFEEAATRLLGKHVISRPRAQEMAGPASRPGVDLRALRAMPELGADTRFRRADLRAGRSGLRHEASSVRNELLSRGTGAEEGCIPAWSPTRARIRMMSVRRSAMR